MRIPEYITSVFKRRLGIKVTPGMLTCLVTYRCNARCRMCDSWMLESSDELQIDDYVRIFKELPVLDIVRLSGGEPFLRKDFPEIAEAAVKYLKPSLLHVSTNGYLTESIIDFCKNRDRSSKLILMFSIDGSEKYHDTQRGRRGSWQRAMTAIYALAPLRKKLNMDITVNHTITEKNGIDEFRFMEKIFDDIKVSHGAVLAYNESATYSKNKDRSVINEVSRNINPEILKNFFQYASSRGANSENPGYSLAKNYYYQGVLHRKYSGTGKPNPPCAALFSHFRINPDGSIPICQFNSNTVGNLKQQSFNEIWNSVEAAKQRLRVKKCGGCWAECEVLPSALYSGEILSYSIFGR